MISVLFPQESACLKQMEKEEKSDCSGQDVCFNLSRLILALWAQIADTQQFFTGKLYVPVHTLKLPAEELLWSALHQMTQAEEVDWEWERRKEDGVPQIQYPHWSLIIFNVWVTFAFIEYVF